MSKRRDAGKCVERLDRAVSEVARLLHEEDSGIWAELSGCRTALREIQASLTLSGVDERGIAQLRSMLQDQRESLAGMAAQIQEIGDRVSELWEMLLEVHNHVARRDDAVRAALLDLKSTLTAVPPNLRSHVAGENASIPAGRMSHEEYRQLIDHIRDLAGRTFPPDARVLVVSKGDEALLDLDGRTAEHFPQDERGGYAGYYPADSVAAIAHLEMLRERGAEYLLVPRPAFWWLEHYPEFRTHLSGRYRTVAHDICIIFVLRERPTERHEVTGHGATTQYEHLRCQIRDVVRSVLPAGARVLVVSKGDEALLDLDGRTAEHFPQDERGGYAGYYPADSVAAIAHLEMLRERGAEYLLVPRPAFWWLEHYSEFRTHLARHYSLAVRQDYVCLIFCLHERDNDWNGHSEFPQAEITA